MSPFFSFHYSSLRDCTRYYAQGEKNLPARKSGGLRFALPTGPVLPVKLHEALRAFDGFLFGFEVENGEAADDFLRTR